MSQAIITALKALKLHGMAANYPEVAAQARHTEFSPEAFLSVAARRTGRAHGALHGIPDGRSPLPRPPRSGGL